MNEISNLPSLSDLLTQNLIFKLTSNLIVLLRLTKLSKLGASPATNGNGVDFVSIDKTTPTERVTAPGFAQMFEDFIKGVDQKEKISAKKRRT